MNSDKLALQQEMLAYAEDLRKREPYIDSEGIRDALTSRFATSTEIGKVDRRPLTSNPADWINGGGRILIAVINWFGKKEPTPEDHGDAIKQIIEGVVIILSDNKK